MRRKDTDFFRMGNLLKNKDVIFDENESRSFEEVESILQELER